MPAATESEMSEAESYCELDEEHTMCKYKDGTGGRCGNQVCSRVFSDQSYKDKIVEKHNKYRREVAEGDVSGIPASSDMEKVEWDDQIARVAQRCKRISCPLFLALLLTTLLSEAARFFNFQIPFG